MKNISKSLLTNMYREQRRFAYCGKQYTRGIHVSFSENQPGFINGFVTKWGEITAHIVYNENSNKIYCYSFKKNKMIEKNGKTKTLFKHIAQVIKNYEEIREEAEMQVAV